MASLSRCRHPCLQTDAASNEDNADDSDSFTGRLVSKILANMQVIVRRIHVRFEDFSSPECPRAFGVCISELSGSHFDDLITWYLVSCFYLAVVVFTVIVFMLPSTHGMLCNHCKCSHHDR